MIIDNKLLIIVIFIFHNYLVYSRDFTYLTIICSVRNFKFSHYNNIRPPVYLFHFLFRDHISLKTESYQEYITFSSRLLIFQEKMIGL